MSSAGKRYSTNRPISNAFAPADPVPVQENFSPTVQSTPRGGGFGTPPVPLAPTAQQAQATPTPSLQSQLDAAIYPTGPNPKSYDYAVNYNGTTFQGTQSGLQMFIGDLAAGKNPTYYQFGGKNYVSQTGAEYASAYSQLSPSPLGGGLFQFGSGSSEVLGTKPELQSLITGVVKGTPQNIYSALGLNFVSQSDLQSFASQYSGLPTGTTVNPQTGAVSLNLSSFLTPPATVNPLAGVPSQYNPVFLTGASVQGYGAAVRLPSQYLQATHINSPGFDEGLIQYSFLPATFSNAQAAQSFLGSLLGSAYPDPSEFIAPHGQSATLIALNPATGTPQSYIAPPNVVAAYQSANAAFQGAGNAGNLVLPSGFVTGNVPNYGPAPAPGTTYNQNSAQQILNFETQNLQQTAFQNYSKQLQSQITQSNGLYYVPGISAGFTSQAAAKQAALDIANGNLPSLYTLPSSSTAPGGVVTFTQDQLSPFLQSSQGQAYINSLIQQSGYISEGGARRMPTYSINLPGIQNQTFGSQADILNYLNSGGSGLQVSLSGLIGTPSEVATSNASYIATSTRGQPVTGAQIGSILGQQTLQNNPALASYINSFPSNALFNLSKTGAVSLDLNVPLPTSAYTSIPLSQVPGAVQTLNTEGLGLGALLANPGISGAATLQTNPNFQVTGANYNDYLQYLSNYKALQGPETQYQTDVATYQAVLNNPSGFTLAQLNAVASPIGVAPVSIPNAKPNQTFTLGFNQAAGENLIVPTVSPSAKPSPITDLFTAPALLGGTSLGKEVTAELSSILNSYNQFTSNVQSRYLQYGQTAEAAPPSAQNFAKFLASEVGVTSANILNPTLPFTTKVPTQYLPAQIAGEAADVFLGGAALGEAGVPGAVLSKAAQGAVVSSVIGAGAQISLTELGNYNPTIAQDLGTGQYTLQTPSGQQTFSTMRAANAYISQYNQQNPSTPITSTPQFQKQNPFDPYSIARDIEVGIPLGATGTLAGYYLTEGLSSAVPSAGRLLAGTSVSSSLARASLSSGVNVGLTLPFTRNPDQLTISALMGFGSSIYSDYTPLRLNTLSTQYSPKGLAISSADEANEINNTAAVTDAKGNIVTPARYQVQGNKVVDTQNGQTVWDFTNQGYSGKTLSLEVGKGYDLFSYGSVNGERYLQLGTAAVSPKAYTVPEGGININVPETFATPADTRAVAAGLGLTPDAYRNLVGANISEQALTQAVSLGRAVQGAKVPTPDRATVVQALAEVEGMDPAAAAQLVDATSTFGGNVSIYGSAAARILARASYTPEELAARGVQAPGDIDVMAFGKGTAQAYQNAVGGQSALDLEASTTTRLQAAMRSINQTLYGKTGIALGDVTLYHGTTTGNANAILNEGFESGSFLTNDPEVAARFALRQAGISGGGIALLKATASPTDLFGTRYMDVGYFKGTGAYETRVAGYERAFIPSLSEVKIVTSDMPESLQDTFGFTTVGKGRVYLGTSYNELNPADVYQQTLETIEHEQIHQSLGKIFGEGTTTAYDSLESMYPDQTISSGVTSGMKLMRIAPGAEKFQPESSTELKRLNVPYTGPDVRAELLTAVSPEDLAAAQRAASALQVHTDDEPTAAGIANVAVKGTPLGLGTSEDIRLKEGFPRGQGITTMSYPDYTLRMLSSASAVRELTPATLEEQITGLPADVSQAMSGSGRTAYLREQTAFAAEQGQPFYDVGTAAYRSSSDVKSSDPFKALTSLKILQEVGTKGIFRSQVNIPTQDIEYYAYLKTATGELTPEEYAKITGSTTAALASEMSTAEIQRFTNPTQISRSLGLNEEIEPERFVSPNRARSFSSEIGESPDTYPSTFESPASSTESPQSPASVLTSAAISSGGSSLLLASLPSSYVRSTRRPSPQPNRSPSSPTDSVESVPSVPSTPSVTLTSLLPSANLESVPSLPSLPSISSRPTSPESTPYTISPYSVEYSSSPFSSSTPRSPSSSSFPSPSTPPSSSYPRKPTTPPLQYYAWDKRPAITLDELSPFYREIAHGINADPLGLWESYTGVNFSSVPSVASRQEPNALNQTAADTAYRNLQRSISRDRGVSLAAEASGAFDYNAGLALEQSLQSQSRTSPRGSTAFGIADPTAAVAATFGTKSSSAVVNQMSFAPAPLTAREKLDQRRNARQAMGEFTFASRKQAGTALIYFRTKSSSSPSSTGSLSSPLTDLLGASVPGFSQKQSQARRSSLGFFGV